MWRGVEWQGMPSVDAKALVIDWANRVKGLDRVIGVWARTENSILHVYTLIEDDRKIERRLYKTELEFFDAWKQPPVLFHVTSDPEFREYGLGATPPILVRSD